MSPSTAKRTLHIRLAWTQAKVDAGRESAPCLKSMAEEVSAMRWALEQLGVLDEGAFETFLARAKSKLGARVSVLPIGTAGKDQGT